MYKNSRGLQSLYLRNFDKHITENASNIKKIIIKSIDFGILHNDPKIIKELMIVANKYLIDKQFIVIIPKNSIGTLIGLFDMKHTVQIRAKNNKDPDGKFSSVFEYDLGLEISITNHDYGLLAPPFLLHKFKFCYV